jgi:hypothetical protein
MQTVNIGLDVLFNRDEESTLTLVDYIQRSPTWSHNGIAIPTKFLVADYYEDVEGRGTLELPNFGEHNAGGLVFGCFALTDQLRPEISITRDVLRSLPWNIHATSSLAFMRARTNAATDRLRGWWSAGLFNVPINQDERFLGSIRDDPLLWNERGWPSERIIWTNLGVMSLKEIREACVEGGNEVELFVPTVDLLLKGSVSSWFEEFDFLLPCRAVLVQLGLSVVWRLDDEITGGSLVVKGPDAEPVPEGLWHFPPLFFIPYENSSLLQQHRKALNRRHLFSQWLIEEAPLLARKYPGVLAALRSELGWGGPNEDTMTEQQRYLRINESLERLRRLEPGLGIGRRIFLRKEDFSS